MCHLCDFNFEHCSPLASVLTAPDSNVLSTGATGGHSASSFCTDRSMHLFFPLFLLEISLISFRLNSFITLKTVRELRYVMLFQ